MTKPLLLLLLLIQLVFKAEAGEPKPYEMPRTQVIPIKNSETGAEDKLYIKLPAKYAENKDTKHPVIYFTDPVQHIEILSAATDLLIDDAILVGISWQKDMKFGKEESYLNFIRNDVIKTVESKYRTDPDNRTYFGYSAGALIGAYVLSAHPDTFKNYLLGSPAFKNGPTVTKKVFELESNATKQQTELNANVFVTYGTLEKEAGEHIDEFVAMLKNRNDNSLSLQHMVIEGDHLTAFPLTGVRSVVWLSNLVTGNDKS